VTTVVVTVYALVRNLIITLHPVVLVFNKVAVILGLYIGYTIHRVAVPVIQYIVGC